MDTTINAAEKAQYESKGYLIKRGFFSKQEAELLYKIATADKEMRDNAMLVKDQSGKDTKLTLWFTPGDDAYGLATRSQKMVEGVRTLLGSTSPVCHYRSKVMQKEPKTGGT